MRRVHHYSGLIITAFVALHLANHAMSIVGIDVHLRTMDALRVVYRNPVAETLLLGAVLVQIVSGLRLFLATRNRAGTHNNRLQRWSGLYLAAFLLIHVGAVLAGRYILALDTNFYFGAAGLNVFPFYLFFGPYYGLAIMAFFGHLAAVHARKWNRPLWGLPIGGQVRCILAIGVLVAVGLLYGLTDGFGGVEIPEGYRELVGG